MTSTNAAVGVLSFHNSKETKAILNAVDALGHEPVWLRRQNVESRIQNERFDQTPDVDVIINRLLLTKSDRPLEDLAACAILASDAPTLNAPPAVLKAIHKYWAAVELTAAGVQVPNTIFPFGRKPPEDWEAVCGRPAVRKPAVGTNGHHVKLVDDVSPARHPGTLIQAYRDSMPIDNSDLRIYIVDGRIVGAMRRTAAEGEWRSNVALGGETTNITDSLTAETRRVAKRAAETLDLDYAGVDIVLGEDGPVVIEVNATAGFKGLYGATGRSPAPYIAAAALERIGHDVPRSTIDELAKTLDDSTPVCKPVRSRDDRRSIIGYRTDVQIGGQNGTRTVVGKVDTGADRSTIGMEVAGQVGAGPISDVVDVRIGTMTTRRPLVDIDLAIDGDWQQVRVGVADRSEKRHPVLLGRDVLDDYRIDPRKTPATEE